MSGEKLQDDVIQDVNGSITDRRCNKHECFYVDLQLLNPRNFLALQNHPKKIEVPALEVLTRALSKFNVNITVHHLCAKLRNFVINWNKQKMSVEEGYKVKNILFERKIE